MHVFFPIRWGKGHWCHQLNIKKLEQLNFWTVNHVIYFPLSPCWKILESLGSWYTWTACLRNYWVAQASWRVIETHLMNNCFKVFSLLQIEGKQSGNARGWNIFLNLFIISALIFITFPHYVGDFEEFSYCFPVPC